MRHFDNVKPPIDVNIVAVPGLHSGPPFCVSDAGKVDIIEHIADLKLSKGYKDDCISS